MPTCARDRHPRRARGTGRPGGRAAPSPSTPCRRPSVPASPGGCEACVGLGAARSRGSVLPAQLGGAAGTLAALVEQFGADRAARLPGGLRGRARTRRPRRPLAHRPAPGDAARRRAGGCDRRARRVAADVATLARTEIGEVTVSCRRAARPRCRRSRTRSRRADPLRSASCARTRRPAAPRRGARRGRAPGWRVARGVAGARRAAAARGRSGVTRGSPREPASLRRREGAREPGPRWRSHRRGAAGDRPHTQNRRRAVPPADRGRIGRRGPRRAHRGAGRGIRSRHLPRSSTPRTTSASRPAWRTPLSAKPARASHDRARDSRPPRRPAPPPPPFSCSDRRSARRRSCGRV